MHEILNDIVSTFVQSRTGPWNSLGDALLVGEGNLSFAKSLLTLPFAQITFMIATTHEKEIHLSSETRKNANFLGHAGALVLDDTDATSLEKKLTPYEFDTIIFQFPNVGSRKAKYGHNPNHILIRKFLENSSGYLKENGRIIITTIDSPYYEGVFQFEEAAQFAGYKLLEAWPFDPSLFPGYSHTNTKDDGSALKNHHQFSTWIFGQKP